MRQNVLKQEVKIKIYFITIYSDSLIIFTLTCGYIILAICANKMTAALGKVITKS